jgi:DNA-binding NtrC family response regulator
VVNCGAFPEGTIDSELFGHVKGAFTSAIADRKGYFEVADRGTLFLDEVGELPLATQTKLLRVLEQGEIIPVGSSKVQKVDVRIVAATNVALLHAISKGKFREDLYYRLNTVSINVPPLRERKEDIYLLFRKFAADYAEQYHRPAIHLTPDAQEVLVKYRWAGNVRELKNITLRMSVLEQGSDINAEKLKTYLTAPDQTHLPALLTNEDAKTFAQEREVIYYLLSELKKELDELKQSGVKAAHPTPSVDTKPYTAYPIVNAPKVEKREQTQYQYADEVSDEVLEETTPATLTEKIQTIEEVEKEMIAKALMRHQGKRRNAAQELGISERTLYRKLKEYEME